eukprot:TRINITY_DN5542_c0_g1_i1.p1 TRINITY_DN5542_c0_g1~~TRINITY_DN5542_c0_g1_i1.p1  ORF type:complete len:735 (+),score=177.05 TRINITY_DN5542_c0_g1_i1:47-2206(+)
MAHQDHSGPYREGVLLKYTNYMKGFQPRYFVLEHGTISYYRSKEELNHTCRGTLVLVNAEIKTGVGHNFVISVPGANGHHGQSYHLRANSEAERSAWIRELQLAKQFSSNRRMEKSGSLSKLHAAKPAAQKPVAATAGEPADGSDDEFFSDEESELLANPDPPLRATLEDAAAQLSALQRAAKRVLRELGAHVPADATEHLTAMTQALESLATDINRFVSMSSSHHDRWQQLFTSSETKRNALADVLESLAVEHRHLESTAERVTKASASSDDFQDAHSRLQSVSVPVAQTQATLEEAAEVEQEVQTRNVIPYKPDKKVSLWSIMKNSIGRDLSKIPMPVNFSEPISFTQRLSEDCEYYNLLDSAVAETDPHVRLALVATFTLSSFASGAWRTGKPFNPLLGETFELDRMATKGFRVILEQVSHHPPICAMHATSVNGWTFWQEFSMSSKFRGKYLEIIPTGLSHVIFDKTGDHYTWTKVSTTIHNIIVGKLWLENSGKMDVRNHTTGDVCQLNYTGYSLFSSSPARQVLGEVKDARGSLKLGMIGTWDEAMYRHAPGQPDQDRQLLWQRHEHLPNYELMYGFTKMAIESNQLTPYEKNCAITDARFRMDKNLMEAGDYDMANRMKQLLEEAQRYRRRQYEKTKTSWSPRWFELRPDPIQQGRQTHQYKGGYFEAKAANDYSAHDLVDIYDISPVADKDKEAAAMAEKAKLMNAWKGDQ